MGKIKVIYGGFAGGKSSSSRKKHARKIRSQREVMSVDRSAKRPKAGHEPITFKEEEAEALSQPHDDPLVLSAVVSNFLVRRILVDSGSSADIIFLQAFQQLNVGLEKLQPVHSPLVGFTGDRIAPLGSIALPVTLGPHHTKSQGP